MSLRLSDIGRTFDQQDGTMWLQRDANLSFRVHFGFANRARCGVQDSPLYY